MKTPIISEDAKHKDEVCRRCLTEKNFELSPLFILSTFDSDRPWDYDIDLTGFLEGPNFKQYTPSVLRQPLTS